MKKLLFVLALGATMVACDDAKSGAASSEQPKGDTTTQTVDTSKKVMDTTTSAVVDTTKKVMDKVVETGKDVKAVADTAAKKMAK